MCSHNRTATASLRPLVLGVEHLGRHRRRVALGEVVPREVLDAVLEILSRDPASFDGNAVYDEELLREAGVEDFSRYNLTEGDPAPMSAQMFDPDYERPE